MSESDRREPPSEGTAPSSRRSGLFRRGHGEDETQSAKDKDGVKAGSTAPPRSQPNAQPKSETEAEKLSPEMQGAGKARRVELDEDGKVSTLLETTGKEVKQLLKAADDAAQKIREAAQTESDSGVEGKKVSGEGGSLVGRINREVQQVLEAADDAADKIRMEARSEARQVVEEARRRAESVTKRQMDRVSEMTDQVLSELSSVQARLERLQGAYDEAMKVMGTDLSTQEPGVWETQQNGDIEVEEETESLRRRLGKRTPRKRAEEPEEISEGARLLALQQMMAGVDPAVIERRLRDEFGIDDPKPILDWMGLHGAAPTKPQKS